MVSQHYFSTCWSGKNSLRLAVQSEGVGNLQHDEDAITACRQTLIFCRKRRPRREIPLSPWWLLAFTLKEHVNTASPEPEKWKCPKISLFKGHKTSGTALLQLTTPPSRAIVSTLKDKMSLWFRRVPKKKNTGMLKNLFKGFGYFFSFSFSEVIGQ